MITNFKLHVKNVIQKKCPVVRGTIMRVHFTNVNLMKCYVYRCETNPHHVASSCLVERSPHAVHKSGKITQNV